jgi:predicted RNA-binding protein YlxR (DUF448 family)
VGCRQRTAKDGLLRIAVVGDECVADLRGTLPGRGAYLHPDIACYDQAVRRRAFSRAYRTQGPLATERLRQWVGQAEHTARKEAAPAASPVNPVHEKEIRERHG